MARGGLGPPTPAFSVRSDLDLLRGDPDSADQMRLMHNHRNTLIVGALILAVIGGLLIIVPRSGDAETPPHESLAAELKTVRGQIALHNWHHPESPYDQTIRPGPGFWEPLIKARYLRGAPMNVLQQSSLIVDSPRMGAGWVWRDGHVYGIDEHGRLYDADGDGRPD